MSLEFKGRLGAGDINPGLQTPGLSNPSLGDGRHSEGVCRQRPEEGRSRGPAAAGLGEKRKSQRRSRGGDRESVLPQNSKEGKGWQEGSAGPDAASSLLSSSQSCAPPSFALFFSV